MAKPIEPTPTLKGEKAINFVRQMLSEDNNPSPKRLQLIREALKIKFNFVKPA